MAWLINTTAAATLKINGTDYSPNLISCTLSDSSVLGSGYITTQGRLELGELPGQSVLLDYGKKKFQRGAVVTIDLTIDGVKRRHPRGYLLILDSSYNQANRSTTINVGCSLTLFGITDNISSLKSYTSFTLPEEATYSDLGNALQAERAFLWQNGQGQIQKRSFFGNDGLGSNKEAAAWVSVRDHTAIDSSPLGVGAVVPDTVLVTYTWLEDGEAEPPLDEDDSGTRYEENISESFYWLEHPANLKQTQTVCSTDAAGQKTCTTRDIFDGKRTFSVTKNTTDRTYYGGPGGSTSQQISVTIGPAVELNGSYYAELYSYEVARNDGNPSGIELRGLNSVTQQTQEKVYTYGPGGEVVQTVDRTYKNVLGAMTQSDWRASSTAAYESADPEAPTTGGVQRGFLTSPPTGTYYLAQQVTTTWQYFDDRTVEETRTLTSSADCNNVGIYPKDGERTLIALDATENGVETIERRSSLSGIVNPSQPARIGDGDPAKVTKSATITNVSQRYPITAAGSVTQELSVPYQQDSATENEAREVAESYATYYRDLLEGDSAGIRVAEAMRPEIFNYYPGMPFTFYDRTAQKVIKLRMNASAWGITAQDAIVTTDGLFIGESDGTVTIGSNV
ncbi:MAG: hypothetical protein ACO3GU_02265 [Pelagibacteraceae bacterium]